jgi:hypothetical protein
MNKYFETIKESLNHLVDKKTPFGIKALISLVLVKEILTISLIIFLIYLIILSFGNAPCSYYDFALNESAAREIMETCLK